jgi:hypothetical protein
MVKERIKKEQKPIKIFTLDVETRGFRGPIFRAGLYGGGDDYTAKNNFKELKQILLNASLTQDVHIFIHNLNFEMSKIIQDLSGEISFLNSIIINGRMAIIKTKDFTFHDSYSLFPKSLEKLSKDFNVKDKKIDITERLKGTKYYVEKEFQQVTVYDEENDVKTVIIKQLPENARCDKEKTKSNFFMEVDPENDLLNEYLKADCTGLYEIITVAMGISGIPASDFLMNPTTAALALQTYKTKFPYQFKIATKSKYEGRNLDVEKKLKAAYYGGRTEVFKNRCLNGYHYDYNSLYPFSMETFKYPIGDYKQINGLNAKIQYKMYKASGKGGGVARVLVNVPKKLNKQAIPILPVRTEQSKKLLFPVGQFWGTWTLPEIEFAESRGVKILEFDYMIYYYEMADLFSKYVNHFKKIKEDNAKDKPGRNESLYEYSKTLLNALYGKFATERERLTYTSLREIPETIEKLEKKKEFFEPEISFFKDLLTLGYENLPQVRENFIKRWPDNYIYRMPKTYKQRGSDEQLFSYLTYITGDYVQIQLSAYITSYSRIHLYKAFENTWKNKGSVYYCDTDSLVTDKKLDDELIHGSQFGLLELEGTIKDAVYNNPKMYAELKENGEYVLKFKGLPQEKVKQFNIDDYKYLLKRQELKDQDRILLIDVSEGYENLIKPITALKQGKDFNYMLPIEKSLNIRQATSKRKMNVQKNTSEPWNMSPDQPNYLPDLFYDIYEVNKQYAESRKFNRYEKFILENGHIKTPTKGSYLYDMFLEIDPKIRKKYFRVNGPASILDLAKAVEVYHEKDLIENFQCMGE